MANELITIDESGITVSSFDVAKEAFDRDVQETFGGDIDTHVHTPQAQFAAINASVWSEMNEEILRGILYGADLDVAPGKFLDALGTLLDIRRRPATKTRVECQLSGVSGTVVPRGSIVQDTSGNRYQTDTDVSIPAFGAEATVTCTALEYGPISVPSGAITRIISVINGWEVVKNSEEGIEGTSRETDAEYRANIKARTTINASSTLGALGSALDQAGAVKYKVIENPTTVPSTQGGITIPPHSIVIAVSGGLGDDLARAVINNRGMGVNVYTAVEGSKDYEKSAVASMDNTRFIFDDVLFKDINISTAGNGAAIATILNAYPNAPANYPTFSGSTDRIISFFDWDDEATGFRDVDGQVSVPAKVSTGFNVVSAVQYGRRVRVEFDAEVGNVQALSGTGSPFVSVSSTSSASTSTVNGTTVVRGNTIEFTASADFPTLDDRVLTLFMQHGTSPNFQPSVRSVDYIFAPISVALEQLDTDNDAAPSQVIAWAQPGNASATVWASCFVPSSASGKAITKWQYRRYDGTRIIPADVNWVDVGNSASTTISIPLSGFDNAKSNARVEVRAVNSDGDETIAYTNNFDTSGTAVSIITADSYADGQVVVLTANVGLASAQVTSANGWTVSVGGSANPVVAQYVSGSTISLLLTNAVAEGAAVRVRYQRLNPVGGIDNRVRSPTHNYLANFNYVTLTNNTVAGIPASPISVRAWRTFPTHAGTTIAWIPNHDGGKAIDRYEYRTRSVNTVNWSAWNVVAGSSVRTIDFLDNTYEVQMRASNPNIRFVDVFGLSTAHAPPPFLRAVQYNLQIGIELNNTGTLTGDILQTIRRAIVSQVRSYDLGSRIWANDLFALVERITGTEVNFNSSDTYVRYNGIGINDTNAAPVPVYAEWAVSESDISILFVN